MNRFAILKGLSSPIPKPDEVNSLRCFKCNYKMLISVVGEAFCKNCKKSWDLKASPYHPVDIEIFGQEYMGRLNSLNFDKKTGIIFWVDPSFITKIFGLGMVPNSFEASSRLVGREIHFHYNHAVYYLLIQKANFENVTENTDQIKITLEGTIR